MNKDTREALARLEAELLAGEDPSHIDDDELDLLLEEFLEEDEPQAPAPVTGVRAYNADQTDEDLEVYSDRVYAEPEKPGHGLNILALISIALSALALAYLLAQYL
ncbi:MAG: hypothetical protein IKC09_10020 [Oscillospiraceae bacterium]|nr:hypothetical protein [Oscillospiraceae bacterium]